MKKESHLSTRKKAHLRFYVPPHTRVVVCLSCESVLGESILGTNVANDYANYEGRSNGCGLFDDSDKSDASSGAPGGTNGKTVWDE